MDASKSKPKKYSIRYKGEPDGFITELEILAWKMMDKEPPESLTGKRKPNQESFFEKIAENPRAEKRQWTARQYVCRHLRQSMQDQ